MRWPDELLEEPSSWASGDPGSWRGAEQLRPWELLEPVSSMVAARDLVPEPVSAMVSAAAAAGVGGRRVGDVVPAASVRWRRLPESTGRRQDRSPWRRRLG